MALLRKDQRLLLSCLDLFLDTSGTSLSPLPNIKDKEKSGVLILLLLSSSQPNITYTLSISSIFSTILESKFYSEFTDDKDVPCSNVPVTLWLIPPQLQVPEIMYYLSFHILTTGILSVSTAFINSLNYSFVWYCFPIFIFHYFHDVIKTKVLPTNNHC